MARWRSRSSTYWVRNRAAALRVHISILTCSLSPHTSPHLSVFIGEAGDGKEANQALLNAANIVTWILRFHPCFCLAKGLEHAIYIQAYEFWKGKQLSAWSEPILLGEVIFLACEAVLYLWLAICIDKWSTNPRAVSIWRKFVRVVTCRCWCADKNVAVGDISAALPDDDDVLSEQERVLKGEANGDLIVASDLTKVYDNGKVAVNRLSLGIPHGECFGLLGINGKSHIPNGAVFLD